MSLNASLTESSPVCKEHSERTAVATCTRCGRFVCDSCVGAQRICPECVRHQFLSLPPAAPRAQWVTRFLSAHVALDTLFILVALWGLSASEPSTPRDFAEGLIGLGVFGVFIGAVITFLRWLHLAVRHAQALELDVGVTPGWAVGYWFIPFANLVKPYETVRNLLSKLGGASAVASANVGLWWAAWLLGNMLSQLHSRMTVEDMEAPTSDSAYSVGILASVLSIAGALLCIGVVRATQRVLDAKRP
jgi:hypothetical protein